MKKIVSLVLAVAMCGAMSTACSGKTEKEKVKLIIKVPPLNADNGLDESIPAVDFLKNIGDDFTAEYQEADVEIEVVQFAYTEEIEYISGCFGTENATDVLMAGYFNMSSYIYGGNVVPLDDIISDELKSDFNTGEFSLGQVNGKTYMLPFYSLQNTLTYNKNLFMQCGLSKYIGEELTIQHWTPEEWEEILSTLKEKLPEMTYPMLMYAKNNQGDTHIMTLLRSRGSSFFDDDGYFNLNTPEGIEALKWIKDCYDKGYFPANCENIELSDNMTLYNNNQLAIAMSNNTLAHQLDTERDGLVNFPSMDGKGYCTSFVTGFMVFDNDDELKLKTAKDFVKFIYSKDEYLDYEREGIPANISVAERSADLVFNLDEYFQNSSTAVNFTENNPNWQGSDTSVRSVFYPHIHDLLTGEETPEECAEGIDRDCNAAIKEGRT